MSVVPGIGPLNHPTLSSLKRCRFALLSDLGDHTESGYIVAQWLRCAASASLMYFPLVFKTVSDQADSVSSNNSRIPPFRWCLRKSYKPYYQRSFACI